MRGDLDWIVMKALEKDRTRRYETASDFARDIERHLGSEPVSAAAPGLLYLASKFIRRNRPRLAFAALAVVAVVLAVTAGKFALNSLTEGQDFVAKGTNTVFAFAHSGDVKSLSRLLDDNPRLVHQRDATGLTPLAYAAHAGMTNTLRLLVARGAVVDATNGVGRTPLMLATQEGHNAAVAVLLEAGADPNHAGKQGETALFLAVDARATEAGHLLLAKGARVDPVELTWKATPLHFAAMLGYADFVELLLTHGARTDLKDANGSTPLHGASGLSNAKALRACRWMEMSSCAIDATAPRDQPPTGSPIPASLPGEDLRGGQHRRVAELLLARKADLEATNNAGLHTAPDRSAVHQPSRAEALVAHQANLNARAKGLHAAEPRRVEGSVPLAELLLKAGANPDLQDDTGFTPLNTAAEHGHDRGRERCSRMEPIPIWRVPTARRRCTAPPVDGDLELLRLLLDKGAFLHARQNRNAALLGGRCAEQRGRQVSAGWGRCQTFAEQKP